MHLNTWILWKILFRFGFTLYGSVLCHKNLESKAGMKAVSLFLVLSFRALRLRLSLLKNPKWN